MKKQISKVEIKQSVKVFALFYLILSAIFCIPFGIYLIAVYGVQEGVPLFFVPLVYAIGGAVLFFVAAYVYNIAADLVGGVEFQVKDVDK